MRMPRPKATGPFASAFHHCISRVVEKRMHFGDREKKRLVEDMRRHAAFGFCRVVTYCMMSNHFHVLVEVPNRPREEDIAKLFPDDDALERHLAETLGSKAAARFAKVRLLADKHSNPILLGQMREKLLSRMWDVSAFMKGFKQDFTLWFNGTRERIGTLWESRFKSLIVEPGQALATIAAYIDLNPVRANLVDDPAEYPWCGYAQGMAGNSLALKGLGIVAAQCGETQTTPEAILARYRLALYGDAMTEETNADGTPGKRGFSREEVMEVIKAGGKVPAAQLIRCKVRHFSEGVAVGSKLFVESIFQNFRSLFSPKRKDGARPLRALPKDGRLFALRDLRKNTAV